jgi:RNA polymerase-binding protein DksA
MASTTGFSDDRASGIQARLNERAAQLRQEIRDTLARSNDETHVRIAESVRDEGDDSFSDLIVDLNFADIDRDAQELRRIDGALVRLQDGSYGQCEDCDQPIAQARLDAEPTASRCIACQERYERTHASPSTPTL